MEDFHRSSSYGNYGQNMQIESYYGAPRPHDFRSYSVSYVQTQMVGPKDLKLKKGKSVSGSLTKSWSLTDPEIKRKKRVASYKMYSVEGKVKGSFRKSFRWLKDKYTKLSVSLLFTIIGITTIFSPSLFQLIITAEAAISFNGYN
ncbi:hypothetical protein RIF29_12552 [Crotalaria pallida]|uniref:Uncharacterized protein n=1 Tax=Crotalaria pallida TaxID=3830 RepID=A0AAN9INC9_CROPI